MPPSAGWWMNSSRLFGGRMQPVMAQLIEAGNLTPKDVTDAEKLLRELAAKRKKDA